MLRNRIYFVNNVIFHLTSENSVVASLNHKPINQHFMLEITLQKVVHKSVDKSIINRYLHYYPVDKIVDNLMR